MLSGVQLIEQDLDLLQVAGVEAFGEPAEERSKKIAGLIPPALIAPEPRMLIAARNSQDFACCALATASARSKYSFRSRRIRLRRE